MNKFNKKGFTLVELLAVIVILALIVVIAINAIHDRVEKSNANAIKVNANKYVKAVNDMATMSIRESVKYDNGIFEVKSIPSDSLKLSGTKPTDGYVIIEDFEVVDACLIFKNYTVHFENAVASSVVEDDECKIDNFVYAYTGSEQVFTAPVAGKYKIEVWGAQGGNGQTSSNSIGGYGAYSVGEISLNSHEKLYINVGGKGADNLTQDTVTTEGGYNGGGRGYRAGSGGGATSVAKQSGLLAMVTDLNNVIIVAGGGGGGAASRYSSTSRGGNGGGNAGENGYKEGGRCNASGDNRCAIAGNQTQGGITTYGDSNASYRGKYGAGGDAGYFTIGGSGAMGGGGAGLYGGSGSYDGDSDLDSGGGAGGSGYIGNPFLSSKYMTCNGCVVSDLSNTKTTSVTCANEDPTADCAKIGDGYAIITYVGK